MQALRQMREEMERRKQAAANQAQASKAQGAAPTVPPRGAIPANPTLGRVLDRTPVEGSHGVRDGLPPVQLTNAKPMGRAQAEALLKGGANALAEPIPEGYRAISKNQKDEAALVAAYCWAAGLISFDFETNADQEEGVDILEDIVVGLSVSWEPFKAVYFPVAHDSYGANWDVQELFAYFKELWESEEILKIAFNIKFEHQILLRHDIEMPYVNVADPMIMVQMTAQFEEMALKTVTSEILPYLFDKYGEYVLTENVPEEELAELYIDDGDEKKWMWVNVAFGGSWIPEGDPAYRNNGTKKEVTLADFKEKRQRDIFWDLFVVPFKKVTERTVIDGYYKTTTKNAKKGDPKFKKIRVSFNEMPVDKKTIDYGCKDSDWALQVYLKLKPILEAEGLMVVHDLLDAPFMMVLGEMELNGWRWNPDHLQKMYDEADAVLEQSVYPVLKAELEGMLMDYMVDGEIIVPAGRYGMGRWRGKDVALEIKSAKPFNWGSTQHLQWLFFHVLRIDASELKIERSKTTGLPSTGADEIDKMIFANRDLHFFRTLLKKREYEKIRDTYAKGMLQWVRAETHRIHASLKLVRTWRLSCGKPNLQNIPRLDNDKVGIRKASYARPGYMYCSTDFSQIELRVVAYYANDENMKDAYRKNQDLHSRVAKEVWKLECAVEEVKKKYKAFRYKAKAVNFGIVYGSTEYGLYNNLNGDALHKSVMEDVEYIEITLEECKNTIDNYKATFPGLVAYANEQINFAREKGYVETLFRHRRAIPDINHPNEWKRKAAENQCMNTPVQGTAADFIRLAMVNYAKELKARAKLDPRWKEVRMVIQIHDDLITEFPAEMSKEVAVLQKEVMERDVNLFLEQIGAPADFDVPIIADPAIGSIWANLLDLDFKSDGEVCVYLKETKAEALDVTLDDLSEEEVDLYQLAGISGYVGKERVF